MAKIELIRTSCINIICAGKELSNYVGYSYIRILPTCTSLFRNEVKNHRLLIARIHEYSHVLLDTLDLSLFICPRCSSSQQKTKFSYNQNVWKFIVFAPTPLKISFHFPRPFHLMLLMSRQPQYHKVI